ncbi:putative repeat protein (TIGR01451 family) [Saccharothrix carnea]|uniref:Putative repeat protein (TIGR01451 family) n=1 Tax=Saccharothrix carnea TaxID=1280637 RepID=A0A2P8HWZ4_SACCR|nr:hypothetical protein [Saccharothrix carnea]PSL50718.1 putative repeat protein (TIGR01451 family) [Saccharothrix carnea]
MTEHTDPLPRAVYWRRRALALAGSVVALVLVVWLVGVLVGRGDPAPVVAQPSSSPPEPAATPAVVSSSSTSPPPSPATSVAPSPTLPPGPPPPCEDAQVAVAAEVDKPETPAGQPVRFTIVISNTGPLPCAKEIGRHVRELVVTSADGATRLWSSNDCFATEGSEVRVMQPGERFTYGLQWPGSTSGPGCREQSRLGAGDYLLTALVAGKASTPVVFRVT